ncbi:MAG TPA: exopolysaccharide biosynthesis polyprenyl glycosylphosphotransferase [Nocardioidaceae bacterium]|nr:exopolysaccharide biosynthesis polyprenyl glycosylphosphotransferase [Nocardioidaceae bacterium]
MGRERTPRQPRVARQRVVAKARVVVMTADLCVGLVGLVIAALAHAPAAGLAMIVWAASMVLHTYRCGRFADVVDIRTYAWLNGQVMLAVVVAGVLLTDAKGSQRAAVAIAVAATVGMGLRWALARARVRSLLGLETPETVLLVGNQESVARTIAEWSGSAQVRIAGVCLSGTGRLPSEVGDVPVVGRVRDVATEARYLGVDIVALHDVENLGGYSLAALQWALEDLGAQTSLITPMTNTAVGRARTRRVGRRVTLDVVYSRPCGFVAHTKGAIDRSLGLVALIIAAPVIAVCAVVVKVTSSGPAFFTQTRVREHGREFPMYKLRTMTTDAEDRLEELLPLNIVGGDGMFKMVTDPRVTRVGAWMRRLSLDELPQLWNVVRGDMSLIGPRPGTPDEVATYDELAFRRLAVKPGLTGLWQVSGRSNLTWDETIRIDQFYVDNWLPRRDVAIALRTVKALVTKEGAY